MVVTTLKSFGTGQVTLPKEWRKKYDTDLYLARETKNGLFIKPITYDDSDFEMVEYDDGESFGWHFPNGIPAGVLADKLKQAKLKESKKATKAFSRTTGKRSRKN